MKKFILIALPIVLFSVSQLAFAASQPSPNTFSLSDYQSASPITFDVTQFMDASSSAYCDANSSDCKFVIFYNNARYVSPDYIPDDTNFYDWSVNLISDTGSFNWVLAVSAGSCNGGFTQTHYSSYKSCLDSNSVTYFEGGFTVLAPPPAGVVVPTGLGGSYTAEVASQVSDPGTLEILSLAVGVPLAFWIMAALIHFIPRYKVRRGSRRKIRDLDRAMIKSFGNDPDKY